MKCESKPFARVHRRYEIIEKELKKHLGIKGNILSMIILPGTGKTPGQILNGLNSDDALWEIKTEESDNK